MSFKKLGLSENTLKAVADAGYETPTPIQVDAIPKVLEGKDIVGIAQTGTGKTASFTLPMIDILGKGRARARMPRSLILSPTRELAAQISEDFESYGKYAKLENALLIGGTSMGNQEAKLNRGVDVLIATPGRLMDHFQNGKILLTDIKVFVIDEADRMLDMGFIPDIEKIASVLPRRRQTLLFSATMPPPIRKLAEKFLNNPVQISVAPAASTSKNVVQLLVKVPSNYHKKQDSLLKVLKQENPKSALIFCNRKRDIDGVLKTLVHEKYSAAALHGDIHQSIRTATLEKFKKGEIRFLVASDVAARGIDVDKLSHVLNFDVPFQAEDYVHRIGRTGRAGETGRAITLYSSEDKKYLDAIEKITKQTFEILDLGQGDRPLPSPSVKEKPSTTHSSKHFKKSPKKLSDPVRKTSPTPPVSEGFGDDIPSFLSAPTSKKN